MTDYDDEIRTLIRPQFIRFLVVAGLCFVGWTVLAVIML